LGIILDPQIIGTPDRVKTAPWKDSPYAASTSPKAREGVSFGRDHTP
jgi:hypothetical protein